MDNIKIGDYFTRIPKCEADGSNYTIYKARMEYAADSASIRDHLDGTAIAPFPVTVPGIGATQAELTSFAQYERELTLFRARQGVLKQAIASTIPDDLFLRVQSAGGAAGMWKRVLEEFERKSKMVAVDLRRKLQNERCSNTSNVRTHLEKLQRLRTELVRLGSDPGDDNFTAIVLGSLPKSWDPYISSLMAAATMVNKILSSSELIRYLNDEADRQGTNPSTSKKDERDVAFTTGDRSGGRKSSPNANVECYNCHKKGHVKADCWSKGGGKEGQGPKKGRGKGRGKGKGKSGEGANAATEDGVWMADAEDEWFMQAEANVLAYCEEGAGLDRGITNSADDCWLYDSDDEDDADLLESEEEGDISVDSDSENEDAPEPAHTSIDIPDTTCTCTHEFRPCNKLQQTAALAAQVGNTMLESHSATDSTESWDSCSDSSTDTDSWFDEDELPAVRAFMQALCETDSEAEDGDDMPDLESVSDSSDGGSDYGSNDAPESWATKSISDAGEGEYSLPETEAAELLDCFETTIHQWLDQQDDYAGETLTSSFTTAMLANDGAAPGTETDLYDSGASRHMSPHRHRFTNYISIPPRSISAADNGQFMAIGQGDMRINVPGAHGGTVSILLKDVLHAPKLGLTLVSISKITDAGCSVLFRDKICKIFDKRRRPLGIVNKENGTYRVNHDAEPGVVAAAADTDETVTVEQLHRRMGHIAPDAAKRLVKEAKGIRLDESSTIESCDSCRYAKMTRKAVSKERADDTLQADTLGDVIVSDLWGPSPTETINKRQYYASFTDICTRWVRIYLQRHKDETFDSYEAFEAWLFTQFKVRIKKLHSDRGGEFWSNEFDAHLAKAGTERSFTVHDTPEHNGVAERLNRTLLERVRAMLHASRLPKFLWGEAIVHATYLKNRTPTRALNGKTPYEALYKCKPNLRKLPEFGQRVWVHDTDESKLDGRGKVGHWVGFDEVSSGHRIYFEGKRTVAVERSVRFENDEFVPFPVEWETEGESGNVIPPSTGLNTASTHQKPMPPPDPSTPTPAKSTVKTPPSTSLPLPASPSIDKLRENLMRMAGRDPLGPQFEGEEEREDAPAVPRRGSRIRTQAPRTPETYAQYRERKGGAPGPEQVDNDDDTAAAAMCEEWEMVDVLEANLAAATSQAEALDPTWEEARKRPDWPHWEAAIKAELSALKDAGTFQLVSRPLGKNVVDCKWVLRIKKNAAGEIEKYKARLVARGFTQVHGVDYYETFAPTAKLASIRTILAIAARNDWDIDMFDFNSAYLNGELDEGEEIYMEQPPGYETANRRSFVWRLRKALYGLKQGGRRWYETLSRALAELGLTQCAHDHAVFYARQDGHFVILAIHVDDCTITGSSADLLRQYKEQIAARFKMTDLGPISWLLGIEIIRDREARTISLCQRSYITSILRRFNYLEDIKPVATPMDPNVHLSNEHCATSLRDMQLMRHVPYRESVGSLTLGARGAAVEVQPTLCRRRAVDEPSAFHPTS